MSDTWDQSVFDAVLSEYMRHTKRTYTEVLNTKAFFIARKALAFTKKASAQDIGDTLGRLVAVRRTSLTLRSVKSQRFELAPAREYDAPLAALIVNARAAPGEGKYGPQMTLAIRKMINSRMRSIAFLKSGWIPAIRILEPYARDKRGAAPRDPQARIFGQEKGSAVPAIEGETMITSIINSALGTGATGSKALAKYGGEALDRAFADEAASMQAYIDQRVQAATEEANLKL